MTVPLVDNILAQPEAIRRVAAHQFGEGKPALLEAAAMLRSSNRVILSGMGASLSACIPLSCRLASKGILAPVIETSELLYSFASAIDEHTIVVLVSRSGESVEATKLLANLRDRGVAVIGVSNVPGSTLALNSTQSILISSPSDQLVAIQSYTATVIVLLLLGAAIADELETGLKSDLEATADVLSDWIPECLELSLTWRAFFEDAAPLYFLGRGASLASVAEAVLLTHEVAKSPAVGMSAPNFRHGPVEVVAERFHGIIFGSTGHIGELNAALAENISGMKGNVRWVGPAMTNRSIVQLCPWPAGVPDRFASVVEIIPIQIAAYRMAEASGVVPGEFRYAPLITLSEVGFTGV